MSDSSEIETLRNENATLRQQVKELQERLSSYTNNDHHKKYYEAHKQEVKDKARVYLDNLKETNPDKLKQYRHTAYLNRKKKQEMESL